MRILQRYLLRQFLISSATVLAGLFLTWFTAEAVLHLDRFRDQPGDAWRITFLRSLEVLPLGLPIACLSGAVWTLTRASRFLELTAIRSGGIRLRGVLAPIPIVAVVLGVAVAFFEDRVMVPVRERIGELTDDDSLPGSVSAVTRSNGRWWVAQGRFIVTAEEYDPSSLRLEEVTIFELDARRRIVRRMDAARALYRGERSWDLQDARILDFEAKAGPELRRRQTAMLELELSDRDLERAFPAPEATSLHRLVGWIRRHEGDPAQLVPLKATFHAKLAQPFALPILVLFAIGFSVGHAERRDTLGRAMLRSLVAAAIYWTVWTGGLLVAGSGRVPAAFPVWTVTLLFLTGGAYLYRAIPE